MRGWKAGDHVGKIVLEVAPLSACACANRAQDYIAAKLAAPKGAALFISKSRRKPVAQPLMPHATAAWLVDNSSLTFEQIAEFCGLHILEVQAIADDTAATKLTGRDPIRAGELTHEEIEKGQKDPDYQLQMHKAPDPVRRTKGPRYTPVSKRQDKPDGIAWIIKNHPEVTDGQISKLIGTTRTTIARDPRPQPLEHGEHHAEGPGDARPDHPARARRGGRQGGQGGGHAGADRHPLRRRPRGADRAASQRARAACPRRRGGAWPEPATKPARRDRARASATRSRTRRSNSRRLIWSRGEGQKLAMATAAEPTSAS